MSNDQYMQHGKSLNIIVYFLIYAILYMDTGFVFMSQVTQYPRKPHLYWNFWLYVHKWTSKIFSNYRFSRSVLRFSKTTYYLTPYRVCHTLSSRVIWSKYLSAVQYQSKPQGYLDVRLRTGYPEAHHIVLRKYIPYGS